MSNEKPKSERLMRLKEVVAETTLCKASIYRLRQEGRFPNPVRLIGRSVAWRREDVERWLNGLPVQPPEAPRPAEINSG